MQAIISGYFYIRCVNFMLKGKSFSDYTIHFLIANFKNDQI